MVRSKRFELSRVSPQRPQRCASTNSATTALLKVFMSYQIFLEKATFLSYKIYFFQKKLDFHKNSSYLLEEERRLIMTFELYKLPYDLNALEPFISEKTLRFHYEKHHTGYVNTLNSLIKGTDLENKSLEDIILATEKESSQQAIFNNAAQTWNHTFYWQSLSPHAGNNIPDGDFKEAVSRDFGSIENLKEELKKAATTQFGSGWAWLILESGKLKVVKTSNANIPLHHQKPLLTIDVWEHAYYLDYQNRRLDYVQSILDNLINWNFAIQNFHQI